MAVGVQNVGSVLAETAARYPGRTGFAQGDRRDTWATLDGRANALAHGLLDLGLERAERVMAVSPNSHWLYESMYAITRAGGVYVPINARLTFPEIVEHANLCDAAVAIVHESCLGFEVADLLDQTPIRFLVICGDTNRAASSPDAHDYEAVVAAHLGSPAIDIPVAYDDPAWHHFSSGTSGQPKGSVTSHGTLAYIVNNRLADVVPGLGPDGALLAIGPLTHGTGTMSLTATSVGAPIHALPGGRVDPDLAWATIEAEGITTTFVVPTILVRMIDALEARPRDISSLRHLVYTGAPMPRNYTARSLDLLAERLVQYYGAGEFMGLGTVLTPAMHVAARDGTFDIVGCVGRPRTGTVLRLMSEDLVPVGPGEVGEICVKGPGLVTAYYKNDAAQRESFQGGWFRSGDLGRIDEGGRVYIVGRTKEIFKTGGLQVAPKEVEDQLLLHPDIAEACVVGVEDEEWGEKGVAILVPRAGAGPTAPEVRAFLEGRLAGYKIPKEVLAWERVPKTAYGKIDRKEIKARLQAAATERTGH